MPPRRPGRRIAAPIGNTHLADEVFRPAPGTGQQHAENGERRSVLFQTIRFRRIQPSSTRAYETRAGIMSRLLNGASPVVLRRAGIACARSARRVWLALPSALPA
jgi:hypothetical protein